MIQVPIGRAVLYVLSNSDPRHEQTFIQWCNDIHHFETMEVDGFLSLRRFDRLTGSHPDNAYAYLTLYQLADEEAAASRSYDRHSETYVPLPAEVLEGLTYERAIFRALPVAGEITALDGTAMQPIGQCAVSVVTRSSESDDAGSWVQQTLLPAVCGCAGVVSARSFVDTADDRRHLLQVEVDQEASIDGVVDCINVADAPKEVEELRWVAFRQAFPATGALLRDRRFTAA